MQTANSTRALALAALAALAAQPAAHGADEISPEYAQGYALVYMQADKLKNIDKLLIVKGESDRVEEITQSVAELSAAISADLEAFASSRDWVVLDREHLPPVEAGARDRMGLDIAGELLFSFGCNFEQKLLFTEAVAVLRLLGLSQEMEDRSPDDEQQELWAGLVADIEPVFGDIRGLLEPCGGQDAQDDR